MPSQHEREEQAIYDAYHNGEIDQQEMNRQLRELEREYAEDIRARAEEAAEAAYKDVTGDYW